MARSVSDFGTPFWSPKLICVPWWLKVIPQYCIAHLLRIISRVISARAFKMAALSLRLDLAVEVNRHFLENEYGDLSFVLCCIEWVSDRFLFEE